MLGLDMIGALSFGGSKTGGANAAADGVTAKAKKVLASAGKAKKIGAYANKAIDRAKNAKAQAAKVVKAVKAKAKATTKAVSAQTAAAAAKAQAQAPMQTTAAKAQVQAPQVQAKAQMQMPVRAATSRMMIHGNYIGDDTYGPPAPGDGSGYVTQQANEAQTFALLAEMTAYNNALDDASQILSLLQQITQYLPQLQAGGQTDLYSQGLSLQTEAVNYDPNSPTDLATRGAQWVAAARNAGAAASGPGAVTPPPTLPPTTVAPSPPPGLPDGGGYGGDSGGGGGGGSFGGGGGGGGDDAQALEEQAQAEAQGEPQEEGFNSDGGGDGFNSDGGGGGMNSDGGGDGYNSDVGDTDLPDDQSYDDNGDQVVGLRGLDLIGASRNVFMGAYDGDSSVRSPTSTRTEVRSPTSTRTEVRSPTRTATEVRSPTRTSTETEATTKGNFTLTATGGAGAGATHVTVNMPGYADVARRYADADRDATFESRAAQDGGEENAPSAARSRMTQSNEGFVMGLHGLDVIGASPSPFVVGVDAGLDINAVNRAVRGCKPMSAAQAQAYIKMALYGLSAADAYDPNSPGATSRRVTLGNHLQYASMTIDETKVDPLPETAAEPLRNLVLQAVAEYNSVADGVESERQQLMQLFSDLVANAKGLIVDPGVSLLTALKWIAIGIGSLAGVGFVAWGLSSAAKLKGARR